MALVEEVLFVSTALVIGTLLVSPVESEALVPMAGAFVELDWFSMELFPHPARRAVAQTKKIIFMI
jgi:hypothetical protein